MKQCCRTLSFSRKRNVECHTIKFNFSFFALWSVNDNNETIIMENIRQQD